MFCSAHCRLEFTRFANCVTPAEKKLIGQDVCQSSQPTAVVVSPLADKIVEKKPVKVSVTVSYSV